MARDITGTGRITVVPPRPADVVRLLVDGEVVMAQDSLQLHGHSKARYAASDYDDLFGLMHCCEV